MPPAKHSSIRRQLSLLLVFISAFSVLLTTLAFSIFNFSHIRQNMVDELTLTAQILGERSSAAIIYRDEASAHEFLKVFGLKPSIMFACLYDKTGTPFAHYTGDNATTKLCPKYSEEHITEFTHDRLYLSRNIILVGEIAGAIYIESDVDEIQQAIQRNIFTALIICVAVMIISVILALRLQGQVSRPIYELFKTARAIYEGGNYSVRANVSDAHTQELSTLVNTFNKMLTHIEERDQELLQKTVALEEAKEIAESASRTKSDFLACMSHELRTPLNAIINFSEIMCKEMMGPMANDKYREYALDINSSGSHLLSIINDILDLSKAEAGMIHIDESNVDLKEVIAESVKTLSERAKEGNVILTVDVDEDLPVIFVDRLRIKQVILNLLSNAVKFTEDGGEVTISAKVEYRKKAPSAFVLSVQDTGIGIAKQDIEQAMRRFGQVYNGFSRKFDGTGLGLPLTKRLTELHGGKLTIKSAVGKGTTVSIRFPKERICLET